MPDHEVLAEKLRVFSSHLKGELRSIKEIA